MSQRKTYYEFSGVSPGATSDEIDDKFRDLARKYRAEDVVNRPDAQNLWRHISQAYKVLNDPVRRAEYDQTLSKLAPPPAAPIRPQPATPAPAPRRSPLSSPLELPAMGRLLSQAEGDAFAEAGQWAEALAAYRSALGRQPNPPLQAKIARMEEQLGRRNSPAPQQALRDNEPPASERTPFWRRLLGRAGSTV